MRSIRSAKRVIPNALGGPLLGQAADNQSNGRAPV
jgi:hypothetical protein